MLFYSPNNEHFFCKYKSINKIDTSILKNTSLTIDENVSLFWSIDLIIENLKDDFNTIYEQSNLDKSNIIVIIF